MKTLVSPGVKISMFPLALAFGQSSPLERNRHTQRNAMLAKLTGRALAGHVVVVRGSELGGCSVYVTVANELRIPALRFAGIKAHGNPRVHAELDAGAVLQSELKDSATIQRCRTAEVERGFQHPDILQSQSECSRGLLYWCVRQVDQLKCRANGEIGPPSGFARARMHQQIVFELSRRQADSVRLIAQILVKHDLGLFCIHREEQLQRRHPARVRALQAVFDHDGADLYYTATFNLIASLGAWTRSCLVPR